MIETAYMTYRINLLNINMINSIISLGKNTDINPVTLLVHSNLARVRFYENIRGVRHEIIQFFLLNGT